MTTRNFYSIEYYDLFNQMVIKHGFLTDEEEAEIRAKIASTKSDVTIVKLIGGCNFPNEFNGQLATVDQLLGWGYTET